ncbi:GcrA family cell cycle regulator [Xanthobacter sp. V0B-10]|uniref:GcrA family cell cycle regulator n=1 Tax=Xanthobacter albus TaxID=3119929 RepID=UPI003726B0BE
MSTWHEAELAIVKRMWEAGESARETARALAEAGFVRSRNAVIGAAFRMGYRRPVIVAPVERAATVEKKPRRPRAKPAPKIESPRSPEEPEPELVPAAPSCLVSPAGGVALVDLEHWHCRFVVSERPSRFCGRPKAFGTSYCIDCVHRVFTPEGVERLKAGKKPPQHVKAAA